MTGFSNVKMSNLTLEASQQAVGGGLEEQEVRDRICEVMEGGRKAFEMRYKRITA